ncbi:MAG: hypothetical protein AB7P04_00660 [Bacteriovoracia bacterium]
MKLAKQWGVFGLVVSALGATNAFAAPKDDCSPLNTCVGIRIQRNAEGKWDREGKETGVFQVLPDGEKFCRGANHWSLGVTFSDGMLFVANINELDPLEREALKNGKTNYMVVGEFIKDSPLFDRFSSSRVALDAKTLGATLIVDDEVYYQVVCTAEKKKK